MKSLWRPLVWRHPRRYSTTSAFQCDQAYVCQRGGYAIELCAKYLLCIICVLGQTACGVIHQVDRAPLSPVRLPQQFTTTSTTSSSAEAQHTVDWWKGFQDPELDRLLRRGLGANMDLKTAYARLAAAKATARAAWSGYLPNISAGADLNSSRQVNQFSSDRPPVTIENETLGLRANLSYEVDLWGRVHNAAQAGGAELEATQFDLNTAQITVSSDIVDTWLLAIEQQAILQLLQAQLETNQTYLELVELRFRQGLSNALDVYQQRQQVAAVEAQIPTVSAQLAVFEHRLATLMGQSPGSVKVTRTELPRVPIRPEVSIPAKVLLQRPDIQAAQKRVVAADHRVGSAIAARFPTLNLTAATGFTGFNLVQNLFDNFVLRLTAGVLLPLTDQVRLKAEAQRARAQLDEALALYGQRVLVALREIEDALVQEMFQSARVKELIKQLELARVTLAEAQRRYQNGLSDYLPVLTSLQSLQNVERSLVTARRLRLTYRVQLHRALGGLWSDELEKTL